MGSAEPGRRKDETWQTWKPWVLEVSDIDTLDSATWKVEGVQHLLSEWSSAYQLRGENDEANAIRVLEEMPFDAWEQLSEARPKVYDVAGMARLESE